MNTAILLQAAPAQQGGGGIGPANDGCNLRNHVAFHDSSTTEEAEGNSQVPECTC